MSFPRKRESRKYNELWIPALRFASAGMTFFNCRVNNDGCFFIDTETNNCTDTLR